MEGHVHALRGIKLLVAAVAGTVVLVSQELGARQASLRDARREPQQPVFDLQAYFANMEEDVSVYDPASPWIYDKQQWRHRVQQMFKIRQFLDLNTFQRTEVDLGDMRVVTVYRELRRAEGTMTSRLHGRITWVYLKQPDGSWWLWHDHTSELAEGSSRFVDRPIRRNEK